MLTPTKSAPIGRMASPSTPTSSRMETLRELLLLEQHRIESQHRLDSIVKRVDSLHSLLMRSTDLSETRPGRLNGKNRNRMGKGELRSKVVEALRAAGAAGIQVQLLAAALRIPPANLHSWFHSAVKRYPQIQKAGAGQYVLRGEAELIGRTLPRTTGIVSARRSSRFKRGEVSRRIIETLRAAGNTGASVIEIADAIGANYRNVHVWFSSTGKKLPHVQKVARGVYRLNPELENLSRSN